VGAIRFRLRRILNASLAQSAAKMQLGLTFAWARWQLARPVRTATGVLTESTVCLQLGLPSHTAFLRGTIARAKLHTWLLTGTVPMIFSVWGTLTLRAGLTDFAPPTIRLASRPGSSRPGSNALSRTSACLLRRRVLQPKTITRENLLPGWIATRSLTVPP
jgi:hypothetical protein